MLNEPAPCPNRPVPYWLECIMGLPLLRDCAQRILLVADDELNYSPTSDLGLSIFVDELKKMTPPPVITKAHRGPDTTADECKRCFKFDGSVCTANYEQVWLFGKAIFPILEDDELVVLAKFMMAGGGVFATGDHEALGFAMGSNLFRVRKMRDWTSSPIDIERIDTVTNPGPDRQTQFHDQSDEFPQRIFPHYRGSGTSWSPHDLLTSCAGPIEVLPDHPHESVCVNAKKPEEPYEIKGHVLDEFPLVNDVRLVPEIIATSISAGRFLPDVTFPVKPPTTPCCFGAISVWDGHEIREKKQGRIVCDSTWHHFVNANLDGTGAPAQPPNHRCGLRDPVTHEFTPDFHQIAEYYRNIVTWLSPPDRQPLLWFVDLLVERYRLPLVEEWRPLPDDCKWKPRVLLGASVEDALRMNRGRSAAQMVTAALETAGMVKLAALVRPVRSKQAAGADKLGQLITADEVRRGVLGSIFDVFARALPANPSELPKALTAKQYDDASLTERVSQAVVAAAAAANEFYEARAVEAREIIGQTAAVLAQQVASRADTSEETE